MSQFERKLWSIWEHFVQFLVLSVVIMIGTVIVSLGFLLLGVVSSLGDTLYDITGYFGLALVGVVFIQFLIKSGETLTK